jgi:hypothetical protein
MAQNFIDSGREQGFLLPPDVRDWLPADHLAWFVIDAVAQMDLSGFYAAYRADGHCEPGGSAELRWSHLMPDSDAQRRNAVGREKRER